MNSKASAERAAAFAIPRVFESIDDAAASMRDRLPVAILPENIADVLERLPAGAALLDSKADGPRSCRRAPDCYAICRERKLCAAVNFQLRFAPNMLAIKDAFERGVFGDLLDVEVRINLRTPWNYWAFLKGVPRLEVLDVSDSLSRFDSAR